MKNDDGEEAAKNGRILWKSYNFSLIFEKVSISIRGYPYKKGRFFDDFDTFRLYLDKNRSYFMMKEQWKTIIFHQNSIILALFLKNGQSQQWYPIAKSINFLMILILLGSRSRKIDQISWWRSSKNYRFIVDIGCFRPYFDKNRSYFMMKEQ